MEEINQTPITNSPIIDPPQPPKNIFKILFFLFLGLFLIILIILVLFLTKTNKPVISQPQTTGNIIIPSPTLIPTQTINPTQISVVPTTNPIVDWKIYTNTKYNYSFKYSPNLEINKSYSTEDSVCLTEIIDGGMCILTADIKPNTKKLTLDQVVAGSNQMRDYSKEIKFESINIDNIPAQKYTIIPFEDYGNTGIFLLLGNNILETRGDAGVAKNKDLFNQFMNTFKFN